MGKPIFYGTQGCHLCEKGEALLRARGVAFEPVDIAKDDSLLEKYGLSIPVLRGSEGEELCWPFDEATLKKFLAAR